MEKKFCTNCGKELKDGETCDCTKNTSNSSANSINTDAIITSGKGAWNTVLNMFKKPDTTINEELKKSDANTSIILLIVTAITYALFIMANVSMLVKTTVNVVNEKTYGLTSYTSADISVPYFKIFAYGVIIYALMAVIPMLSAFVMAKLTKTNFSFKDAFKLYVTCNAPMALVYLVVAILLLLNISLLNVLSYIVIIVMSIVCFFNFILGYNKLLKVSENRRSYAISSMFIIWVVVEVIVIALICGSVISDVYKEVTGTTSSSYKSSSSSNFSWD